ncbi:MAG: hypothetical protein ACREV9_07630 [Burkholderiales bacterium]
MTTLSIDKHVLESLEHLHGDSFYIVDLEAFFDKYHELLQAFRAHYENSQIAYSYKTNYTPRLCEMVEAWGGYAEVVSRMEYDLARRIGVAPERIVFNGPYKSEQDLMLALDSGSIVNLDWPYQLAAVKKLASRLRRAVIGVRVTFAVPGARPSRFGFDAEGPQIGAVMEALRELRNVEIAGLHCHFLTPTRSVEDYRFITRRMLDLGEKYFGDSPPRMINVGGGYFSSMKPELQRQFGVSVPTFQNYAKAIAAEFAVRFPRGGPQLILEPGIGITATAVKFAARVIDVHVLGVRKLALVAGSVYDIKPTLNSRNLPVQIIAANKEGRSVGGPVDIVGYTCMEHDVLYAGFEGELRAGDWVIFDNVGAYTNVLRPPFIRECPAMLGYQNGQFEVLKRGQNFDDVFGAYSFNGVSARADH